MDAATNMMRMKPIIWFSWQPTPYNDFLFRSLAAKPDFDLHVVYRQSVTSSHPWRTPLGAGYKSRCYGLFFGLDWPSLKLPFKTPDALFVVAGWDHLTCQVLLALLRLLRREYVVWTDSPYITKKRNRVKGWLRELWLRWILTGARRVLVTGDAGVESMVAMGAPVSNTTSFPFFLDLDRFRRAESVSRGVLRFVSSGRVANYLKGHDVAVRALAAGMVGYSGPWEYVIAGTGKDVEAVQGLATHLGIQKNLRMAGWMEPDDLIQLYLTSDVLIHPSPIHDPFPNAVLEGMAASCVVMASDVCGSAIDRIEPGVNGYLHPAGNWRILAEQIRVVASDAGKRQRIGKLARSVAEQWPVARGIQIISACVE